MIFKILITFLVISMMFSSAYAIDTDDDGLTDTLENRIGTDINSMDTDGDGFADGVEVELSTDPLDDNSSPESKITGFSISEMPVKDYMLSLLVITILSQIGLVMYMRSRNGKFN
jgi:hypothetical protein